MNKKKSAVNIITPTVNTNKKMNKKNTKYITINIKLTKPTADFQSFKRIVNQQWK